QRRGWSRRERHARELTRRSRSSRSLRRAERASGSPWKPVSIVRVARRSLKQDVVRDVTRAVPCPSAVLRVDCRGVFDDTWKRGAGVQKLDLVIRNGTVVDGTGAAPVVADVGVRGDRIVGVGRLAVDAASTIDAAGRIVAPGFIDVHAHDDFALLDRPACEFKVMQGVTTEVVGNCGFGAAPMTPFYEQVLSAFGETLFGPLGDLSWNSTASFLSRLDVARPAL